MLNFKNAFSSLQKIGKCLMLPVSVLPVAGILLGVGSANFSWLPHIVSQVMAQSGGAIFSNLPLLFAIGVAIGLTENDGVAALAGAVGWFVFLAAIGVCAKARGVETTPIMGIPSIDTGVFGGIIVGLIAARAFNRFYKIQLPSYLGFFAGKRSVPIITAFEVIIVGALLSFIWPPIGNGIKAFSNWAAHGQPALAFTLYGVIERSLIPFGLHHVWNVPFFFQAGDYLDPTTGKMVHAEGTALPGAGIGETGAAFCRRARWREGVRQDHRDRSPAREGGRHPDRRGDGLHFRPGKRPLRG